jgi:hypothetical protein
VYSRHAKSGGDYARAARAAEQRPPADAHGDEIDKVVSWAEAVAASAGIGLELPGRLLN